MEEDGSEDGIREGPGVSGRSLCSILSSGQKCQITWVLRTKGSLARNPHVSSSMAVASQMGSCRALDQF